MKFNEHQSRLWSRMLKSIEDFRKGNIQLFDLVGELEGALDAGEFKDDTLVREWYDFWGSLEIVNATKGNHATIEDVYQDLLDMELFLKKHSSNETDDML